MPIMFYAYSQKDDLILVGLPVNFENGEVIFLQKRWLAGSHNHNIEQTFPCQI